MDVLSRVHSVLSGTFHLSTIRPHQIDAIESVLAGKDTVVLLPTGGGKSLCYQLPAVLNGGVTVVLSPLIALMQDQVTAMKALGIDARVYCSTTPAADKRSLQEWNSFKPLILYTTAESLQSVFLTKLLDQLYKKGKVALFAVDECHCISSWGHDFRPKYRQLSILRGKYPTIPIIALTATAIPQVQKDVIESLALKTPHVVKASFNRPNIHYCIRFKLLHEESSFNKLLDDVNRLQFPADMGIVYCNRRETCEEVAAFLNGRRIRSAAYHAGLSASIRVELLQRWKSHKLDVMVATIAFGMGMDQANVRAVFHWNLPKNLESFVQESGRAGRDGLPSQSFLYYNNEDAKMLCWQSDQKEGDQKRIAALCDWCTGTTRCRRLGLLAYFGEAREGGCKKDEEACDCCRSVSTVQKAFAAFERSLCGQPIVSPPSPPTKKQRFDDKKDKRYKGDLPSDPWKALDVLEAAEKREKNAGFCSARSLLRKSKDYS